MVTEASELLELFRFKSDEQILEMMSSERREDVVDELCDTFYFVLRFAQMNGIDLTEGLRSKMAKNAEKYPVSKAKGCNLKYDEVSLRIDPPNVRCGRHSFLSVIVMGPHLE